MMPDADFAAVTMRNGGPVGHAYCRIGLRIVLIDILGSGIASAGRGVRRAGPASGGADWAEGQFTAVIISYPGNRKKRGFCVSGWDPAPPDFELERAGAFMDLTGSDGAAFRAR